MCFSSFQTENDFDRRRQVPLGHPGFTEHQTRFGLSSPLQNFQPSLISNPTPTTLFQQPIFQQPQQPYVPQFNNLLPTQSLQNIPLSNNNAFQFNPVPNVNGPVLQSAFQQQSLRQISPPNQAILSQTVPTLSPFQNNGPIAQNPVFNQNPSPTVHIGNQRPTQAPFLPTLPTVQTFSQPSPITIQPAPNLAPQNQHQTLNFNAQIPFQQPIAQTPLFPNGQTGNLASIPSLEQQSKENLEKLKELQERQRIIQKHQEFVQRQQQKQQEKVEKLHEEFLNKQATKSIPIFSTTENYEQFFRNQEKRRPIHPHETDLFRKAVEMYDREHPTTPTTTTTTTTTTVRPPPTPRYTSRPKLKSRAPPQDRNKQKLYNEIKNLLEESETKGFDDSLRAKSVALLQKPDILKQLRVALAENPEDFSEKNFTSREISLNGQKFEVIRTTNPNLIPQGAITTDGASLARIMSGNTESQKESRINIEDLTKGVLPPGADFELIKQSENGKLEEVSKIPGGLQNKKKVTFVFLEEQDDGSFKVKAVKANGQQTEEGPEVENILNKIKNGEIQLPGGPAKISNSIFSSTTAKPTTDATDYIAESSHHPSSYSSFVTTSNRGSTGHTNPIVHTTPSPTYRNTISQSSRTIAPKTQTFAPVTTTQRYVAQSTTQRNTFPSSTIVNTTPFYRSTPQDLVVIGSSTVAPPVDPANPHLSFASRQSNPGLVEILRENGLFAMSKYLKQSGLDTILNETGPYTIFSPTDKAFRTLLVQLGGPDRAEEKFKDNPRLLSGVSWTDTS